MTLSPGPQVLESDCGPTEPPGDEVLVFPTSLGQQRIWFLEQLERPGAAFNETCAMRLEGAVDATVLERSLHEIVCRHESLRTTFTTHDGQPVQVISPEPATALQILDLRSVPPCDQPGSAEEALQRQARRPFDLARAPLLRATLVLLADEVSIFSFTAHHIILDGWSMGVLLRELSEVYRAFAQGDPSPLENLPIQYADFVVWQNEQLQASAMAEHANYWLQKLTDAPEILPLPSDRPRPAVQTFRGARQPLVLPKELTGRLKALCQDRGVTFYMLLLAAFQVLLARHTGQEDFVVGSPIAGREQIETEDLIGFFLNTLALRSDVAGDPCFSDLLARVRETALEAYTHRALSFERLVELLHPERSLSYSPIFQVMFVHQPAPEDALVLPGVRVTPYSVDNGTAKLDLSLSIREGSHGFGGWFEYNTDLFDRETVARLADHFLTLLAGIVEDPERRLSALPILAAAERQQLLRAWNDTDRTYDASTGLPALFEAQVEATPDAVALIARDQSLTYRELDQRANQLARYLQDQGIDRESRVGICVERGAELVVALLAVQKAGAAFVPLDPAYPSERLEFMITDAGLATVISQARLVARMPMLKTPVILLDAAASRIAAAPSDRPGQRAAADNLAYVLFTSGSTGRPKGVMVTQRNVLNLFAGIDELLKPKSAGTWLAITSLCFDISVIELLWTLTRGFTVVLYTGADDQAAPDNGQTQRYDESIADLITRHAVTHLQCTPSFARMLLVDARNREALRAIQVLILGGEAFPADLAKELRSLIPGAVYNMYGPTETTIYSSAFCVTDAPQAMSTVPIGRPISNTQLYVLDRRLQPVPIGTPGELYIGGDGVARGYLNRPALTAERFLASPFSERGDDRLYRTGDLARFLPDGNVEFLGRLDHQVKIRGFRIELGEIETLLHQHPAVREAVVVAREDRPGDKRLVAYVVPRADGAEAISRLRDYLRAQVPDFMVPAPIVALPALPLTLNGKVDRRALPAPGSVAATQVEPPAARRPLTALEEAVGGIWKELLRLEDIGVDDNFFDLGGHSLLAVQVMARIEVQLGANLPLAVLFRTPTIRQLAEAIEASKQREAWPIVTPLQPDGSLPPLFFFHALDGDIVSYHHLARLLSPEQPVYAVRACGMDGLEEPETDWETMVADYVERVQKIQPHGPYFLAGFSSGGSVAYELARQLWNAGEPVAFVGILDHPSDKDACHRPRMTPRFLRAVMRNSYEALRFRVRLGVREQGRLAARLVRSRFWRRFSTPADGGISNAERRALTAVTKIAGLVAGDPGQLPQAQWRVIAAQYRAWANFQPKPYPGNVTVFRARLQPLTCAHDPSLGWGALAQAGTHVLQVPGRHSTLMHYPHVLSLAAQLRSCLARAHASAGTEISNRATDLGELR